MREAILTRIAESALKGDIKSAAFLLQRLDMVDTAHEYANSGHRWTIKRSSTRT